MLVTAVFKTNCCKLFSSLDLFFSDLCCLYDFLLFAHIQPAEFYFLALEVAANTLATSMKYGMKYRRPISSTHI